MRKIAIGMFAALLTFVIGVATSSLVNRTQPAKPFRHLSGPTCREGLLSVESRPAVPLRITVSDTACEKPQSASVQFLVENVGTKPISKYEIHGVQTYEELTDTGFGVLTERVEPLQPGQTDIGFLGGGVLKGAGGKPVGELKSFELVLWSVEFADGTKWTRTERFRIFPSLTKAAESFCDKQLGIMKASFQRANTHSSESKP